MLETISTERTPAQRALVAQLAIAARSLSLGGHDDFNQGQVSARAPGADVFQIKAATLGFDECTPDDILEATVDATVAAPSLAPPELPLHQAIYEARPDVNAIVHSHAPYTLTFGATALPLRAVSHDGSFFENRINRFTLSSNTILDMETGRAVAAALGDSPALFLQNHGGVIVGKSIRHVTIYAHLLERACQLQLLAESAQTPYSSSHEEDVAGKRDYIYSDLSVRSYWDYSVRRVRRVFPESASWLGGRTT